MKQVTVRKKCEKCKKGEIISTGSAFSNSFATYYEHKCNECGAAINLQSQSYPSTYFEFSPKEKKEVWE